MNGGLKTGIGLFLLLHAKKMSFQKKIPISSISPHASTFQNGLRSFLGLSYELDYYDLVVYSLGL